MAQKDVKIEFYRITEIRPVTHDTLQFKFDLPSPGSFDFFPGDHLKIYPDREKRLEYRLYTPTSTPDTRDHFELIIKHYPAGKVSGYMSARKIGDEIAISGPHFGGHFTDGMARKVGMIAGGSGITPMISMIRHILGHRLEVEISLLFANKTVEDIILKSEFDGYADERDNFSRYYTLDNPPDGWAMGVGRIDETMMMARMPEAGDDTVIFICGPPMMQIGLKNSLVASGYESDRVIFP